MIKLGPAPLSMATPRSYETLLRGVSALLEEARRLAARSVNAIITATYWEVGRRIVEYEQRGATRAAYGEALLAQLGGDLTARFGRGFGKSNLYLMRSFYLAYQDIFQTPSGKSPARAKAWSPTALAERFPLSWSHYVCLLSLDEPAR